jgi:3-deoxy-7-phosphoheptulonate synthase
MKPFKLVSREYQPQDTLIEITTTGQSVTIGEGHCTIIAGPCAVESCDAYLKLACY